MAPKKPQRPRKPHARAFQSMQFTEPLAPFQKALACFTAIDRVAKMFSPTAYFDSIRPAFPVTSDIDEIVNRCSPTASDLMDCVSFPTKAIDDIVNGLGAIARVDPVREALRPFTEINDIIRQVAVPTSLSESVTARREEPRFDERGWSLRPLRTLDKKQNVHDDEVLRELRKIREQLCTPSHDSAPIPATVRGRLRQRAVLRTGAPGRPSSMHLLQGEFQRRKKAGCIEETLADQARVLIDWLVRTHPDAPVPAEKSVKNKLRARYREAKAAK